MSMVITGSSGFLGSALSVMYDRASRIDLRDGLDLLSCDLPKGMDYVFHLASQSSVEASWQDPVHDAKNLQMMVRLVKEYPKARIIYTNTAASRDSSPYGFSKHACADYLKWFHKDYVICTLPNIYGPGSKSVVDLFKDQTVVDIYGDGLQTRDYVHKSDILDALVKALSWPKGEYELGSGVGTTVLELAGEKARVFHPARKEVRHSVLKNSTPNWQPKIILKDYLCA